MKNNEKMKKSVVGSLLLLTLLTASVPTHSAEANTSIADLQAQISRLLAQLEALRQPSSQVSCVPFATDLASGRSGAEVTRLQQFLISQGYTIPAGATGFFGEQTRLALAHYQRAENISPAAGYFGPVTRAKVNVACSVPVLPPVTENGGVTPPTTVPSNPALNGEAAFQDFSLEKGDDATIEEGDENRVIADIEFTVEDGDATLQRIDVVFTPESLNNEKDPWDTFTEVSLWDGNKRLARVDTSRKSAWRDENRSTGAHTLRLSGLTQLLPEGSDQVLSLQVTVANNVRGASDGEGWSVSIPNNGIRALDASRVPVETGNANEVVSITIEEAGTGDELMLRSSNDDPDATTLILERTNRSGFIPVFAFDLDTDDSVNDIEIRRIPVELTVSSGTITTFVRDARLVIDGKRYTRKAIVDGTTGTITFEFRSNELVIDAGDRVTAIVEVDFKPLAVSFEGTTLYGRVAASALAAEGVDDLTGGQLSGTVTGDLHSLKTTGTVVGAKGTSAVVVSSPGATNDYANYRIEVAVTATNQDVYIPANASAVTFELRDASGAAIVASPTAVVSSNAREEGNYFFIPEGQTKTVSLDVTYIPQAALTSARLQLLSIEYAASPITPDQSWAAVPSNLFRTTVVTIVD